MEMLCTAMRCQYVSKNVVKTELSEELTSHHMHAPGEKRPASTDTERLLDQLVQSEGQEDCVNGKYSHFFDSDDEYEREEEEEFGEWIR